MAAAVIGAGVLAGMGMMLAGPAEGQVKEMGGLRRKPVMFQQFPPGMQPPPTTLDAGNASQFSAIKLGGGDNSDYKKYIDVAQDCIKGKEWGDAATALQMILDSKEDFYVQIKQRDGHGRESIRWTSGKFEANNLLGTMAAEGLDVYEVRFGGKARGLLDDATKRGDWEQLADVAQRYQHTKAGAEANELLATYFLDRGQFFTAALRFEKIIGMKAERFTVTDLTLFKTVLAYQRAGEVKKADQIWKQLEPRLEGKGGLKVGDELVPIAKLQQVLKEVPQANFENNPHDWPLIRGNQTNSAQAKGSPPLLDLPFWQRPLSLDKDLEEENEKASKAMVDRAIDVQDKIPNNPVLPGHFPITTGRYLIYRTYSDVRAVYLNDEKDSQGKIINKGGDVFWKSTPLDGSLANVLSHKDLRVTMENWLNNTYFQRAMFTNFLYENSLLGTIATDHRLVYTVDDLAVPAPSNIFPWMWQQGQIPAKVKQYVLGNSLQAFELNTGKFKWRLGNDPENDKHNDTYTDSHFLGVPLSVGGKLYVLNEKNSGAAGDAELRLVCIDPNKMEGDTEDKKHRPRVISLQTLGMVNQQNRVTHDMSRRTNAVHLGYGEGILVCPTNAGEVLGVDLMSRTLAWAYPYREKAIGNPTTPGGPFQPFPQPGVLNFNSSIWRTAPPVIQEGKVVFTAPDAHSVHCINLRDGTPVWKTPQMEGDLYLAGVFQGKVVIVGKNAVRILRLADGGQQFYIPTGDLPSGQGVACKNVYYLPLKKGEITAIDLNRGVIKAHNRASKAGMAPGNLVFSEGVVVSQTPRDIVAYPQLVAQLEIANAAVAANPNNPEKIFSRGELRLFDGQVQDAVDDLHKVLSLKDVPAPLVRKTKDRLYEAMSDLFHLDFNGASAKYLKEYRDLCDVPENNTEKEQRLSKYLRQVGQGRENQGNLVDAFQMYRQFGDLAINKEQGVPALDDPTHKIPTAVWLRGRISAMMERATSQQREPLEAKIAEEWKVVEGKKDMEAIRTFVSMFDVPFKVGREARLKLAESIMAKNDKDAYLEAELNLEQLRVSPYRDEPEVGGRALATLALLEEKKGSADAMKLAAAYYRELGEKFPTVKVRDGKTGADLLNELAVDKRFLPYMGGQSTLWSKVQFAAREIGTGGNFPGYIFQPKGDLTPFMRNHRLVLEPSQLFNNPQVELYDLSTNTSRWKQNVGVDPNNLNLNRLFANFLAQQPQENFLHNPNSRYRFFHVKGHLGVFQIGTRVYGLDLDNGRVRWAHNLIDKIPNNQPVQNMFSDWEGNLDIQYLSPQTGVWTRMRIGSIGAVQASYVALLTHKGLEVLDPLRGTIVWSKMDVPAQTRIFGDDQHIFLVSASSDGTTGAGRVLRASNGEPVDVPDFGFLYNRENRIRVMGHRILAAQASKNGLTLRYYDILAGKDVWAKSFAAGAVRLNTEDKDLTGVLEPDGKMTVLNALTGQKLMEVSVLQGRIKAQDIKTLHDPLLLQDNQRFYLALNQPVDASVVAGSIIRNNFNNGLRCAVVNGWFLAFEKADGKAMFDKEERVWKKGDLAWHSYKPITNQMIVLEQFQNLPVILFSARYNELMKAFGGSAWKTHTQSMDKETGLMIHDVGVQPGNGQPYYQSFNIDMKAGTINMVGFNGTLQHYINDGRKTAELPKQANVVAKGVLTVPATINAQLTNLDPLDPARPGGTRAKIYQVHLKANVTYSIIMESNQLDAYLRLEDDRGSRLAENDDGGPGFGLNSRIVYRPTQTGTFKIFATSLTPAMGNFQLFVREGVVGPQGQLQKGVIRPPIRVPQKFPRP
jgi:outer membrane protein assembly factor BamB